RKPDLVDRIEFLDTRSRKLIDAPIFVCKDLCVSLADVPNVDSKKQPLKSARLARFYLLDQFSRGLLSLPFEIGNVFKLDRIEVRNVFNHSIIDQPIDQHIAEPLDIHRLS